MDDVVRPTGVVTFLLTDIEGSTALWAADDSAMAASLAVHDEIMREVTAANEARMFVKGRYGAVGPGRWTRQR